MLQIVKRDTVGNETGHLRARDSKVLLKTKDREETNVSSGDAQPLLLPVPPAGKAKRQPRLPLRQHGEELAREILAALWPLVAPATKGMTRVGWCGRNKRVAVELAQAGVTVEQVLDAHADASEAYGATVYSLGWVQSHIAKTANRPADDGLPAIIGNDCDPPTERELREAGKLYYQQAGTYDR